MTGRLRIAALAAVVAFLPVAASAVTVGTAATPGATAPVEGGTVSLLAGHVYTIEMDGNAADIGGSMAFGFQGDEKLVAIETNSLNPANGPGFQDATVEWNSRADGTGTSFGSLTGAALINGSLITSFAAGEIKYLIASWSDVSADGSNFDLRVAAAVPLPASILMLLGALGGLGYIGRRRAPVAA